MSRLNKQRLAKLVGEQAGVTATMAQRIISQVFETIADELAKGHTVAIGSFGTWRTKVCSPRKGHNPRDGSVLEIPARTRVSFRPSSKLREAVESSIDPDVFFGDGVALETEVASALARVFGADPATFHLEETRSRIEAVLGPVAEGQAEAFFEAVRREADEADHPADETEAVDPGAVDAWDHDGEGEEPVDSSTADAYDDGWEGDEPVDSGTADAYHDDGEGDEPVDPGPVDPRDHDGGDAYIGPGVADDEDLEGDETEPVDADTADEPDHGIR